MKVCSQFKIWTLNILLQEFEVFLFLVEKIRMFCNSTIPVFSILAAWNIYYVFKFFFHFSVKNFLWVRFSYVNLCVRYYNSGKSNCRRDLICFLLNICHLSIAFRKSRYYSKSISKLNYSNPSYWWWQNCRYRIVIASIWSIFWCIMSKIKCCRFKDRS